MNTHSRENIKVTDGIEYVRRSTFNTTNLNTVHKGKGRSRLYHIPENDFATTCYDQMKTTLHASRPCELL